MAGSMQWVTIFVAVALICFSVRALTERDTSSFLKRILANDEMAMILETAVYVATAVAAALVLWESGRKSIEDVGGAFRGQ